MRTGQGYGNLESPGLLLILPSVFSHQDCLAAPQSLADNCLGYDFLPVIETQAEIMRLFSIDFLNCGKLIIISV